MGQDNIHVEKNFEKYISKKLASLESCEGWRVSPDDTGFDPDTALYMPDFIEYLSGVSPDKAKKMKENFGVNWESNLRIALVKSLENEGTVMTLRNGFPIAGYQTIDCSGHYPEDPRLDRPKLLYEKNILRVMHQVHYQTAGSKSLDFVFFINGIPVATAEVKTEFTQTVQDAIEEYQKERKPIEPGTKRKNYLLMYKRGAVVHFAISEDEIYMCTNLEGNKPLFLPFNQGNNGHAGNPPQGPDSDEYPTGYFWNSICKKENWVKIFHNFIFEKSEKKEDITGRVKTINTQLFPRYHQWSCVTRVIDDVKEKGVGQRYLIEHSAGSGKTETISWIAHDLIRLADENGEKVFSSVIVVTDRVGLDTNIKKTIKQLKKTAGVVAMIGGDDEKKSSKSKNTELFKALKEKRDIIVVTLQTFPYALDIVAKEKCLEGTNFAVLIDEAHSSQGGSYAGTMNEALKLAAAKKKKSQEGFDADDVTDEDAINAFFEMVQSNRTMPENVSFFAFTATPKAETKTLFGRLGDTVDPATDKAIPESFGLYPMRQAIEEGFILDVLPGYMHYHTAYRLREDIVTDKLVDESVALRTIARWKALHPTNVTSKAEFIIEHFVKNVSTMLDGQAKAMIVTSGRPAVVRYKYAIDAYLKKHPEYDRSKIAAHLQFKVPGEPLVAFSEKVNGSKCIMPEDEYLEDNPFAIIDKDFDYTEKNINNLGYQSVENAFDTSLNRLLIVANKFQTGFNQPKLCAMYIDKSISNDIEIVQTYSRLNRTHTGKDRVYIIDFVNKPEKVFRAFKTYDKGAIMEKPQNLEIVYDIKKKLDVSDTYTNSEYEEYKNARYQSIVALEEDKDVYRQRLYKSVAAPADRWLSAYKSQQNAYFTWKKLSKETEKSGDKELIKQVKERLDEIGKDMDDLMDFRKRLQKYCSAYTYISQIIDFGDPDLEIFYGFAKLLNHRISGTTLDEIDMKNLVLEKYSINKADIIGVDEKGVNPLRPMRANSKAKSSKQESLKELIIRINEIWGSEVSPITGARTINAIADYVASDDVSRIQIRNSSNSKDAIIADGRLDNIIKLAAISLKNNDFTELSEKILSDPQALKPLATIIYDLVDTKHRLDITELSDYLEKR